MPTVNTLCALGSLAEVAVVPATLNSDELPISGSGGRDEGVATASAFSFLKPSHRLGAGEIVYRSDNVFLADARIQVDIDTIADRLGRRQQLLDTAAWGNQLNRAVRVGLGQVVTQHITDFENAATLIGQSTLGSLTLSVFALRATGFPSGLMPEALALLTALYRPIGLLSAANMHQAPRSDIPWSFLPFALDRLLAAKAYGLAHSRPIRILPA